MDTLKYTAGCKQNLYFEFQAVTTKLLETLLVQTTDRWHHVTSNANFKLLNCVTGYGLIYEFVFST